jgi:magnesium transporter
VHRYLVTPDGLSASTDRATVTRLLDDGQLLWLDLDGVDDDALSLLREVFGLHPVAVQDVADFGQRPKAEPYGDVTYLVAYGAQGVGRPSAEVHIFYSERFLVTVRREPCQALDQFRVHICRRCWELPEGPTRLILLHHVMDSLIDSYFPVLADFDDRIDTLQEKIFGRPRADQLAELFSMQRWLVGLRKLVTPQRDMVASLAAGVIVLPGATAEREPYVRDLYDHLIRISDLVDSYRDLLSSAMDAYLSMVSNRLNDVMKQLTIIATIFLPLSFLTGFFGQNFDWMTNHLSGMGAFIVFGIGIDLAAAAGLFMLFRRRGWL